MVSKDVQAVLLLPPLSKLFPSPYFCPFAFPHYQLMMKETGADVVNTIAVQQAFCNHPDLSYGQQRLGSYFLLPHGHPHEAANFSLSACTSYPFLYVRVKYSSRFTPRHYEPSCLTLTHSPFPVSRLPTQHPHPPLHQPSLILSIILRSF